MNPTENFLLDGPGFLFCAGSFKRTNGFLNDIHIEFIEGATVLKGVHTTVVTASGVPSLSKKPVWKQRVAFQAIQGRWSMSDSPLTPVPSAFSRDRSTNWNYARFSLHASSRGITTRSASSSPKIIKTPADPVSFLQPSGHCAPCVTIEVTTTVMSDLDVPYSPLYIVSTPRGRNDGQSHSISRSTTSSPQLLTSLNPSTSVSFSKWAPDCEA